jgi:hypothetical protein
MHNENLLSLQVHVPDQQSSAGKTPTVQHVRKLQLALHSA